jgi:hypothetical protein
MPPCSDRPRPVRRRSATSITDSTIGTIIAAVAVFDTHMLTNAVAAMVPPTIALGRVPTSLSVAKAMRRSSPQRWMASASTKPPRKRKITSAP